MTRGLHRAPSRLGRALDRWTAQPYWVRLVKAGIVVVILAGLVQAFAVARHQDRPAEPTAPVISAPLTSMPRVIR